jgi:hypothetical protein
MRARPCVDTAARAHVKLVLPSMPAADKLLRLVQDVIMGKIGPGAGASRRRRLVSVMPSGTHCARIRSLDICADSPMRVETGLSKASAGVAGRRWCMNQEITGRDVPLVFSTPVVRRTTNCDQQLLGLV